MPGHVYYESIVKCPNREGCDLYPLFRLRASLRTWQIRYCEDKFITCIRFRMTERGEPVPPELLPNGKSLPVLQSE